MSKANKIVSQKPISEKSVKELEQHIELLKQEHKKHVHEQMEYGLNILEKKDLSIMISDPSVFHKSLNKYKSNLIDHVNDGVNYYPPNCIFKDY